MFRIKNKPVKRILAFVLSGAMIVSGMSTSAMTAFAAEASTETYSVESPEDTNTHLEEEAAEEQQGDGAKANVDDNSVVETDKEDTDKETDKDVSDKKDSDNEPALDKEALDEKASKEEDAKDSESNAGDAEDEMTASADAEEEEVQDTDVDNKATTHTVWMVGDSTVCSFMDNYYYPRYGYGTQLQNYLDENYKVKNIALSGRSSKSFMVNEKTGKVSDEYDDLTKNIQAGDVLIIGFGHNDEKNEEGRYTNPNGDWQTGGSFAKSLYDNYVEVAEKKGAIAILCTPIVRRNKDIDKLTDANCHIIGNQTDKDGNSYPGGDYPAAIRKLGQDKGITVVDLTALTKELYESEGAAKTLYMHAWTGKKPESVDNTHLNIYGAKKVAYMLATEISKTDLDIAAHIKNLETEPTQENDLVSKSDYVEPEYTAPTGKSELWNNYGIFKGSAFGALGGAPSTSNYTFTKDADGNMNLKSGSANKGKIAGSADGIIMYYYQISADSTFELSAKAKINDIDANTQVAFGLMARDDMYIDTRNDTLASDYVAAGTFGASSVNCFRRQSGTLTRGSEITDVKAGDVYNLSIVKNSDGYACTFGNNATQTGGYDYQLTSIDAEYQYIGMFVARNADITFSDIELIVDNYRINIETGAKTPVEEGGGPGGSQPESAPVESAPVDGSAPVESAPGDGSAPVESAPGDGSAPVESAPVNTSQPESAPGDGSEPESEPVSGSAPHVEEVPEITESKITTGDIVNLNDPLGRVEVKAANIAAGTKPVYRVTVTYKNKAGKLQELTEGVHYTVELAKGSEAGADAKTPGKYWLVVTGTNKELDKTTNLVAYGQVKVKYEVIDVKTAKNDNKDYEKKYNIAKLKIGFDNKSDKNLTYTGTYINPAVSISANKGIDKVYEEGKDYKIVYKNNVNAGKASVTVIGIGECYGQKELKFTIKAANLATDTKLKLDSDNLDIPAPTKGATTATAKQGKESALVYKGKAIVLDGLKVNLGEEPLVEGLDYTVTYSKKNTQKGVSTATIKGMNNYSGAVKVNYEIKNPTLKDNVLDGATAVAELTTKKYAAVTTVTLKTADGQDVTLKAGVDFKAKDEKKVLEGKTTTDASITNPIEVEITGLNSYKKVADGKVKVTVIKKGTFHIKDNTVVDISKKEDNKTLIAGAKITDASGAKLNDKQISVKVKNHRQLTVTPTEAFAGIFDAGDVECHVAKKLGGMFAVVTKNVPVQSFDGVNNVTLTREEVLQYIQPKKGVTATLTKDDIVIVSYKNNNKVGSATVVIRGSENSGYYGTMNVKFKIAGEPTKKTLAPGNDQPGEDESKDDEGSDPEENSDVAGSGSESNDDENLPEESSVADESTPDDPVVTKKVIDVWDFGAKVESDINIYKNNITGADWDAHDNLLSAASGSRSKGQFLNDGTAVFGDLTITYNSGDRVYSNATNKNYGSISGVNKFAYEDGYTADGSYYPGGTGGSNRRYLTIKNVSAGDRIDVYAGMSNAADLANKPTTEKLYFEYQGSEGTQKETVEVTGEPTNLKLPFIAAYSGTYKIWTDTVADLLDNKGQKSAGKPVYNRVKRVPAVDVKGRINIGEYNISNYGLRFINQTDKTLPDITATVKTDGTFTAQLSPGYTYRALLTGVVGYGIVARNNGDKVTTTDANAVNGITNLTFTVESQETYTYSGTIEGFAEDYDVSKLAITMEPTPDFDTNPVELTIDTTAMTFSGNLEPNVRYTLALKGVNDYEIKSPDDICKEDQSSFTGKVITVALKPMYDVIGGFNGLKEDVTVEKLIFENVADKYEYEATVANGGYSIRLRDGEYLAKATVSDENYSTKTHVVVDGGTVSQDLLFVSSASKENIAYEADIYVGYPTQTNNYATVNEAVEAASLMKKEGAARTASERVTIHIAPGTYREQIIVNTPYISFENDTNEEVLITWYYGIGYVYYSAGGGYYNAENAYDKYAKGKVDKWGVAVYLQDGADGFRAKGITFENSFNRYITDEELADGVEPAVKYTSDKLYTDTSIAVERKYGADVTSKSSTERAAAIAIEADQVEFKDCGFYSSQDTLYTGSSKKVVRIYFKNCTIEGQTDYIFGGGNVVYDACELSWKGYSTGSQGGYITAYKHSDKLTGENKEKGYLFRNCTVTANNHNSLTVTKGYFGRPWGAEAAVVLLNTKLQNTNLIEAVGWHEMSGHDPKDANFREYNTTSLDGQTVSTAQRPANTVITTEEEAAKIKVTDYFGSGWTPAYYTADTTGTVAFGAGPTLSDNGDINVPNPGHTLTVNYALTGDDAKNDVSAIKWYIMDDANGTNAKAVKVTTASVDKTYKITTAASGKYIKAEVTPETIDGRKGTTQSVVLSKAVGENYVDPSSGSNITVGDGINVYLAGDSTVMDYSAKGMWNNGKSQDLGSWGEYLQSFFNESEVTVQDFAEGGRSSRSFINDDLTNKKKFSVIKENISEGDYLFIQFGHNDSSVRNNKADVYTPIGAKVNDKYQYTAGAVEVAKKDSDYSYPDYYTWENGEAKWINDGTQGTGTYCWFLQQYVDMALEAGAIPVLMTPVSRMNYGSDGKTKTHHEDEGNSGSYYWEAVKQVYDDNIAEGNKVLFIDTYELTKKLFDDAYAAGGQARGKEIMSIKDGTHNNKLGGMLEAMLVAEAIQNLKTPLSYAVKTPSQISGVTTTEKTVFSIDSSNNFVAYEQKSTGSGDTAVYEDGTFTTKSVYWSTYGNTKLADISKKAGELADSNISDSVVAAPKATSEMSDADGKTIVTVTLSSATGGAKIYYTDDGVTNPKASDGKTAVENAKEYDATNKIVLDKDTTIKAFAMADNKTASKVVTFTFSVKPDVQPPTADKETGSSIASGTVIHLEAMDGAEIRYTMGSGSKVSDPTANSSLYDKNAGLTITSSTTIKAIAIKNGVKSDVATFEYVVNKMQQALSNLSPMMIDASQSIQAA